jgi:hypothetical protein
MWQSHILHFALMSILIGEVLPAATQFSVAKTSTGATSTTMSTTFALPWSPLASDHMEPHEDGRCRCRCPSLSVLAFANVSLNLHPDRQVYVKSTGDGATTALCTCADVVVPEIVNLTLTAARHGMLMDIDGKHNAYHQLVDIFCPRCECMYETRNTSAIKVVVILVLWLVVTLVLYMLFLLCLKPWLTSTRADGNQYQKVQVVDSDERRKNPFCRKTKS